MDTKSFKPRRDPLSSIMLLNVSKLIQNSLNTYIPICILPILFALNHIHRTNPQFGSRPSIVAAFKLLNFVFQNSYIVQKMLPI